MESFLSKLSDFNAGFSAYPMTESPSRYFGNDNKLGYISTVSFSRFVDLYQLLNERYDRGELLPNTVICKLLNLTEIELSDMAHDINLDHEFSEYVRTLPSWKRLPYIFGFYRWYKSMFSGNVEFGWIH